MKLKPKFKTRTLLIVVSVCCVGCAVSAQWYNSSFRQYEALGKLESGGNCMCFLEHQVIRNEQGKFERRSNPLRGIQLMLTKVFDHRVVCTVPAVIFLDQPDEGDLKLVKQLKGVEQIIVVNTPNEALVNEWKRELPDVDVKSIGQ